MSNNKDLAVGAVGIQSSGIIQAGNLAQGAVITRKPAYLITLDAVSSSNKSRKLFLAQKKPDLLTSFVEAQGIYVEESEEEVADKFNEILSSATKERFQEVMFPTHRISSIRNLVYRAK